MRKNRVYSDLHQEFKENCFFKIAKHGNEKEQNLCLAGDIYHISHLLKKEKGRFFLDFFGELSERFNKIFIVYGNHDFYGGKLSKQKIVESQDFFDQFGNVFILSRHTPSIVDDDTVYVGATLWTDFDGRGPTNISYNRHDTESNDFKYITYVSPHGYTKFKPIHWFHEYLADIKWIKSEVENNKDRKVVVITHFSPSEKAVDILDPYNNYSKFYRSALDEFINANSQIKYWFHGHIHNKNKIKLDHALVFSNPIGYKRILDGKPEESLP